MKKMKLTGFLLISAIILLFSSCGAMMVEDAENVSIDLSSVVSKGVGSWAKIWLFPEGTITPVNLGEYAYQEVGADKAIEIYKIPVGPVYKIFISLGTEKTDGTFVLDRTFNGKVTVTGGTATEAPVTEVKFGERGITPIASYTTGDTYNGIAVVDGEFYTISEDGKYLYYGTSRTPVAAPAGFTFNSVTEGYQDKAVISSAHNAGEGFITYNGAYDDAFADGLATKLNNKVDILSADVFWDDTEQIELIVGHTEGGLILSAQDYEKGFHEWKPVDLKPFLDDAGIPLKGQVIKGITVINKSAGETKSLWVYMVSKIGNFRIKLDFTDTGFDLGTDENAIFELFEDFVTGRDPLDARAVLDIDTPDGSSLFIGTDKGLYKASASENISDMLKPDAVPVAAQNKRVSMIACGDNYTACVTPLELLLLKEVNGSIVTASIAFNEGLPVSGLLTGAVTGLDWNGDILYIAGNYGVTAVNAADADLWK